MNCWTKFGINQRIAQDIDRVFVLTFEVKLNGSNLLIWDHGQCTKVPLALVTRQKWVTLCKTMNYGCAYACAPHLVQLKWTHIHIIAREIRVRWETVTIAFTDMKIFPIFIPHPYSNCQSKSKIKWNNLVFALI